MVTKLAGFLTGALVAGLLLFTLTALRAETDEDRLIAVLQDQCLPYVTTGSPPFEALGRRPGEYDGVHLDPHLQDGGAALIYELRFLAQWGRVVRSEANGTVRVCRLEPAHLAQESSAGFSVEPVGFLARFQAVIAPDGALIPDATEISGGPQTVSWLQPGKSASEGLRVSMGVEPGRVFAVLVAQDAVD